MTSQISRLQDNLKRVVVGIRNSENGEIFNDYKNNESSIPMAHITGKNNKAVIKGYKVLETSVEDNNAILRIDADHSANIETGTAFNFFRYVDGEGLYKYRDVVKSVYVLINGVDVTKYSGKNYAYISTTTFKTAAAGDYSIVIQLSKNWRNNMDGNWDACYLSKFNLKGPDGSNLLANMTLDNGMITYDPGGNTEDIYANNGSETKFANKTVDNGETYYIRCGLSGGKNTESLIINATGLNANTTYEFSYAFTGSYEARYFNISSDNIYIFFDNSTEIGKAVVDGELVSAGSTISTDICAGYWLIPVIQNDCGTILTFNSDAYPFAVSMHGSTNKAGLWASADGYKTEALAPASHTEGWKTKAYGERGHAEGNSTEANGHESHAEGYQTKANGYVSHAEGGDTEALGIMSHAEGWNTKAYGHNSHTEGCNTSATGLSSHAEGQDTVSSGDHGHAEGLKTLASGQQSHAEGNLSQATGNESHAEGWGTIASGHYSHTEGVQSKAKMEAAHAGGAWSDATGSMSFAHGYGVKAKTRAQTVFGLLNQDDSDALFIIGNGTGTINSDGTESEDTIRSNAFVVKKDGTGYLNDEIIATESLIDTKIASMVDSAPETLNTLNELAAALGDDPNFATTIATQLGEKADASHTHNASSITAGTLPTSRGGTGVTSIDALRTALGISSYVTAESGVTCNVIGDFAGDSTIYLYYRTWSTGKIEVWGTSSLSLTKNATGTYGITLKSPLLHSNENTTKWKFFTTFRSSRGMTDTADTEMGNVTMCHNSSLSDGTTQSFMVANNSTANMSPGFNVYGIYMP